MAKLTKLFEPGKIGKLELKNRTVFPPMVPRYATDKGFVSQMQMDYYAERAKGGVGLVIIESAYPRSGGYPGRIYLDDDKIIPNLKELVAAVHAGGAKVMLQVNTHRGRSDEVDPASPSENTHPLSGVKARAMTIEEFKRLEQQFGEGARRVRDAGFDGMMIHGGSGYMVSETLSSLANRRTDEYGGSIEKRATFALNLVKQAKKNAGQDFPVIFRITADEMIPNGFNTDDTIIVSKLLEKAGADAIDIVSGINYYNFGSYVVAYMYTPRGHNAALAEAVKKSGIKVPIMVAGRINNALLAEEILAKGQADFVDLGRTLIADPYFVSKAQAGKLQEIRQCLACGRCIETIFKAPVGPMVCSVNPAVSRERAFAEGMKPAVKKKNVLVIGGGPAGMEAAVIATQRGHKVTLWEKRDKLGGVLDIAAAPPGKAEIFELIKWFENELKLLKITVKLNKEAKPDEVIRFGADAVVVASGAKALIPRIKGMETRKVTPFKDVLAGAPLGDKVVVIGGGFVGCEVADYLVEKGKKVTIVEILPELASEFVYVYANVVRGMIKDKGITTYTSVKDEEITPKGIKIVDKDGKSLFIEADDIVISVGSVADRTLAEALKGKVPELYEVGDSQKAARIYEAVYGGAMIGQKL